MLALKRRALRTVCFLEIYPDTSRRFGFDEEPNCLGRIIKVSHICLLASS
jgi:hypothetical protein